MPSQAEVDRFDAACKERGQILDEATAMAQRVRVTSLRLHHERRPRWSANRSRSRQPGRSAGDRRGDRDYVVEIQSWDFDYWLALNTLGNELDPNHEHRGMRMEGRLLRPASLTIDKVEVSLLPSIGLEEGRS
jgi:hypothetical protein